MGRLLSKLFLFLVCVEGTKQISSLLQHKSLENLERAIQGRKGRE